MAFGIPLPPTDFFLTIVDVLAKRYSWSYSEISNNMYWEEVYEMYEYASNLDTLEKNEDMKFNFMLHATSKKALDSWQDAPIPYPDRNWKPPKPSEVDSVANLPQSFKTKVTPPRVAQTEAEKKKIRDRIAYVNKRKAETQKKVQELRMQHMYKGYNS